MALGCFCTDQLRPRPNIFQHRPEARLLISFIIWLGSTVVNLNVLIAWFLLGPYFVTRNRRFYKTSHKPCIFVYYSQYLQNKQFWSYCHIINYFKTDLACSSRTGDNRPSVSFCTDRAAICPCCQEFAPILTSSCTR